jgi:DDE superfamily endonuclease
MAISRVTEGNPCKNSSSVSRASSESKSALTGTRVPRNTDPERQKAVKKLQELMENDEVDLWADEVHFQQHGSRCRMWVPPETKDPVLLHHPTRRSVGYFGAVRLRDGKFRFSRETGRFNAMSFFAFLKMLRRASSKTGRLMVVIADNARYHHARLHKEWRENHVADFRLEYLPPYSPELNPIE